MLFQCRAGANVWHLYPPGEHIPPLFDRLTHCTILNTLLTRTYNAELFFMNHGDQSGFFNLKSS